MSYKLPTPATQGTELLLKLDKNTSTFHIKYGFLYSLQIPRARIAENVPQYGCGGLGNCGAPSLFRNSDFQSLGHCVSECSAVNNKTIHGVRRFSQNSHHRTTLRQPDRRTAKAPPSRIWLEFRRRLPDGERVRSTRTLGRSEGIVGDELEVGDDVKLATTKYWFNWGRTCLSSIRFDLEGRALIWSDLVFRVFHWGWWMVVDVFTVRWSGGGRYTAGNKVCFLG